MRLRNIAIFSAVVLVAVICGSLVGPRPAEAVAREIIELQHDVTTLLQGQKDLATQMTQDHTVMKTLVEQTGDNVGKLNATMSSLQKSVQMSRRILVRASTRCLRKFRVFRTTLRRLSLVSANSISSWSIYRIPCRVWTPRFPAPHPRKLHQPPTIPSLRRPPVAALLPVPCQQGPLRRPIPSIRMACATLPAANTIWPVRNSRTT